MHRDEAKQLLELCRPGCEADRHDPALARAFARLETDSELRAWFEQQQVVDARISDCLNALEAPADLKAGILAGMHLHRAQNGLNSRRSASYGRQEAELQPEQSDQPDQPDTTDPESWSAPFRASATQDRPGRRCAEPATQDSAVRSWWLNPWTGIAALFVMAMVLLNLPVGDPAGEGSAPPQIAVAGLPPVLQFLSREIDSLKTRQFEKRDDQAAILQAYLAGTEAPSPANIPECLAKMATLGCITFEYETAKFSMICFKNGEVYHLITADKATYPGRLPSEPEVFQCPDKTFRVWVDGEQVKILTVHGTPENLPEFI
jgi:hypothetical protein